MQCVVQISESPSEIMESLTVMYNIPKDKQTLLFTHIRLAHGFSNHKKRLQAVQARLHAISILGELKRFLSNTVEVFTPGFNQTHPILCSVFKCTPRVCQQYFV